LEEHVLSYLSAETSFLRAYGNRSLLLIVLCCLTRTGESIGKATVPGLSLDVGPSLIVIFGPVLALLLLISLKTEADTLLIARDAVRDEANGRWRRVSRLVYVLFVVPALSAAFISLQYLLKLVPKDRCNDWSWFNQLADASHWQGTPSTYCIGKGAEGPWIYPPLQSFLYIGCVILCGYITYQLSKDWSKARGGRPRAANSTVGLDP
jgi:hypothetical protein